MSNPDMSILLHPPRPVKTGITGRVLREGGALQGQVTGEVQDRSGAGQPVSRAPVGPHWSSVRLGYS
jgi:hypothetical protein